ncbi:MAG: hypothetical protein L0H19_01665 [Salinisphaera sp.]|nr:hypothetical protein [Salinisphaera sp.]MDN5938025.1 hypothetical protein [Salinisphaera sp.]
MKINIQIDVTPAELRQFLGLPDVAGLQEDMIEYVRERVARGAENFDPADLLRETTVWGNKTLQRIMGLAASRLYPENDGEANKDAAQSRSKRSGRARGKGGD